MRNIHAGAYPHKVARVEAKLYKQWWSQLEPDHVVEVPARAVIANGTELISKAAFHQWIVFEGELYKSREVSSPPLDCLNEYEWENTVFLAGKGYEVFNDINEVKASSRLAEAIRVSKVNLGSLTDAQLSKLAKEVVKLMEELKCEL